MNSVLGQIAVGKSGSRGRVVAESEGVLTLDCDGDVKQVAISAVVRFESQAPTDEPDPYSVGTRLYLKSWLEPWLPGWYTPEWWEVVKPANQHGIYGLRSDSGNWGGLQAWQIERDLISKELK